MLKEFSLEGKKAFITGGGRGLGRAIALVFAEAGADVAVAARTLAQCEETAAQVKKLGRRAFPYQCDIADSRQVDDVVAKATKALGQIDILVNNAGQVTVGPLAPLPIQKPKNAIWDWGADKRMSDDTLNRIMATNVSGTVYCSRAAGEQMLKRRSGKVINVCSSSSIIAYPYETAYAPSKAAAQMFTKVLALEWAQFNVQVNGINPGWFVTDMTRSGFDDPKTMQERIDMVPLKRLTASRDLGLLALYLACPASDWMTGQVLSLDGGESASQF